MEAQEKESSGSHTVVIAILATLLIIAIAAAGLLFVYGSPWQQEGEEQPTFILFAPKEKEPLYYMLKPLVVNVADEGTNKSRYLKASPVVMTLEPEMMALLERDEPKLRSAMISFLRAQTPEQIESTNSFEFIRERLLKLTNKIIDQDEDSTAISDLYFTEFVVN